MKYLKVIFKNQEEFLPRDSNIKFYFILYNIMTHIFHEELNKYNKFYK